LIAKAVLSGHVGKIFPTSLKGLDTLRGQLQTERGLGDDVIAATLRFLAFIGAAHRDTAPFQLCSSWYGSGSCQ